MFICCMPFLALTKYICIKTLFSFHDDAIFFFNSCVLFIEDDILKPIFLYQGYKRAAGRGVEGSTRGGAGRLLTKSQGNQPNSPYFA